MSILYVRLYQMIIEKNLFCQDNVCLCTMYVSQRNCGSRAVAAENAAAGGIFFLTFLAESDNIVLFEYMLFFSKNFPLRQDLVIFMLNFYLLRLNPNLRLSKFVKGLHNKAVTSPLKRNQLNSVLFLYETTTLEILMQKHMIFLWQP